jgi:hypothetical protein
LTHHILGFDSGFVAQQQLYECNVVVLTGPVQRRHPFDILGIHIGSVLEQELADRETAILRCVVELDIYRMKQ